ncbi:sushi domain-containing protein 6 [Tachysurus ichikawai]
MCDGMATRSHALVIVALQLLLFLTTLPTGQASGKSITFSSSSSSSSSSSFTCPGFVSLCCPLPYNRLVTVFHSLGEGSFLWDEDAAVNPVRRSSLSDTHGHSTSLTHFVFYGGAALCVGGTEEVGRDEWGKHVQ